MSPIVKQFVPLDTLLKKHFVIEIFVAKINLILHFFVVQGSGFQNADLRVFSVNVFCPKLFVPSRFVASTFWWCNTFPAEEQEFAFVVRGTGYFFSRALL